MALNREQRRALAKAEKKQTILQTPELTENGKQWIEYCKKCGFDFNQWFISFSGWLNLTKNEKSAVVMELVGTGLVTPDKDSKKSTESGWAKVDKEGNIIEDAGEQDSEGEESVSATVSES